MKTSLFYLASPYSHTDPRIREARYRAAMHVVSEAMLDPVKRRWDSPRIVLYSPIVHNHPLSLVYPLPKDWAFWRTQDFPFLERCDGLIVLQLEGWQESVGVREEILHAESLDIPIHYIERWADFAALSTKA